MGRSFISVKVTNQFFIRVGKGTDFNERSLTVSISFRARHILYTCFRRAFCGCLKTFNDFP